MPRKPHRGTVSTGEHGFWTELVALLLAWLALQALGWWRWGY